MMNICATQSLLHQRAYTHISSSHLALSAISGICEEIHRIDLITVENIENMYIYNPRTHQTARI